jgi:hypothetical protein
LARHCDIAERGLLRCYLLRAGDRPIACIHGKQHRAIYVVDYTFYHPDYEKFSPGTTALHLAIEDLLVHRPARSINLGYGVARHEFRSTGVRTGFDALWLVRKGWRIRLLWMSRMMMQRLGRSLKWAGVALGLLRGRRAHRVRRTAFPLPSPVAADPPGDSGRIPVHSARAAISNG